MTVHRSPEDFLRSRGSLDEDYHPGNEMPLGGEPRSALPLRTLCAADFASLPTPRRRFLDSASLLPMANVTMFSGDGGTGKSLAAMQLAAAVATSSCWLGVSVGQGPVLFLSAEDDEAETHIRLKEICAADGLHLAAMAELRIAVFAGKDAVLAQEADKGARINTTPLFQRLRLTLEQSRPVLLVLDNLADVFAGNENIRPLARQFIGHLRGLAIEFDCAVLLLAHPSLSGIASGSGTSGNTAWNNSVRSRLYLVREVDEQGNELDPDQRILKTMKANYGPTGAEMRLRWETGRFVRVDQEANTSDPAAKASKAERVFLHLLRWHTKKSIKLSPAKSPTYAPALFARHPQSEGLKSRQFERAMTVLLEQDRIVIREEGTPSRLRRVLAIADGKCEVDEE